MAGGATGAAGAAMDVTPGSTRAIVGAGPEFGAEVEGEAAEVVTIECVAIVCAEGAATAGTGGEAGSTSAVCRGGGGAGSVLAIGGADAKTLASAPTVRTGDAGISFCSEATVPLAGSGDDDASLAGDRAGSLCDPD